MSVFYMVMSDSLCAGRLAQFQSDEAARYLTDSEGRILYSSNKELDTDYLNISVLDEKKITDYHLTTLADGRKVILAGRRIGTTGWYCISVIEMAYIMQRALSLLKPILFIAVIYVIFLFVMLLYAAEIYLPAPWNAEKGDGPVCPGDAGFHADRTDRRRRDPQLIPAFQPYDQPHRCADGGLPEGIRGKTGRSFGCFPHS